jgi:hypothetical protein
MRASTSDDKPITQCQQSRESASWSRISRTAGLCRDPWFGFQALCAPHGWLLAPARHGSTIGKLRQPTRICPSDVEGVPHGAGINEIEPTPRTGRRRLGSKERSVGFRHQSRASLRRRHFVSLREGSNTRSTCWFNARIIPTCACISGPRSSAAMISTWVAVCHS